VIPALAAIPIALTVPRIAARAFVRLGTLSERTPQYHGLWSAIMSAPGIAPMLHILFGTGMGGGTIGAGGIVWFSVDSSVIMLASQIGLLGLAIYIVMACAAILPGKKSRLKLALVSGLIASFAFQMFDQQLFLVPTAWNWWLWAGLAMGLAADSSTHAKDAVATHGP
jgi:hypothetical protein